MSDNVRESFEKWYKENVCVDGPWMGCSKVFRSAHAANSWQAWQASRQALAVELPVVSHYQDVDAMHIIKQALDKAGIRYE